MASASAVLSDDIGVHFRIDGSLDDSLDDSMDGSRDEVLPTLARDRRAEARLNSLLLLVAASAIR
ncbi:MAG: hypothetical protein ACKO6N_01240 [Myxococcota bacterium]